MPRRTGVRSMSTQIAPANVKLDADALGWIAVTFDVDRDRAREGVGAAHEPMIHRLSSHRWYTLEFAIVGSTTIKHLITSITSAWYTLEFAIVGSTPRARWPCSG